MSESDAKKKTLTDADITSARADEADEKAVGRRSVLGVLGSLAAGGAASTVMAGCWPRIRYAGGGAGYRSGITDSDGGPYADPAGSGRGRAGYVSGVTDSDGGPYADPAGNGRGRSGGGYTGHTDSDGGPYADRAGYGRGRWR